MKKYWIIDDNGGASQTQYNRLKEAKNHFSFYSQKDADKLVGTMIYHTDGNEVLSSCEYLGRKGRRDLFSRTSRNQ